MIKFARTLLRAQIDSNKIFLFGFKISKWAKIAAETMNIAQTLSLPPGGRGTAEAVKGERAIIL